MSDLNGAEWAPHARALARQVTYPASRWRKAIAAVPRHVFVPAWWDWTGPGSGWGDDPWKPVVGADDKPAWLRTAYSDRSLVTQVAGQHADHAEPGTTVTGRPTSSATLPSLIVQLARHAMISDGMDVLDVGTGSGYGAAVFTYRLGDLHVTSVDVDPHLVESARAALEAAGLCPAVQLCDATGPLPGAFDRIISTVAVRPIPASWLEALRPGGRLVTTITGTGIILTADKTPDGGAAGRVEWDRAGFMATRPTKGDYPARLRDTMGLPKQRGEHVTRVRRPVVDVRDAWELWSLMSIKHPGVEHHYQAGDGDRGTAWMLHPDGSWARARSTPSGHAEVNQSGPRRLWDDLEELRDLWLTRGELQLYGASAVISPAGVVRLHRSGWDAVIS